MAAGILLTGLLVAAIAAFSSCTGCDGPAARPKPPVTRPPLPPLPPARSGHPIVRVRLAESLGDASLAGAGGYRLIAGGQVVHSSNQPLPASAVRRDGRNWWLGNTHVEADSLRLSPAGETQLAFGGRWYRGEIVLQPAADGREFHVDNHVYLEHYVAGVLAREMYASWHAEAFKAQAVAARTYALYETQHDGRGRDFDVYADQRSQVYGGATDETPASHAAIRETWGLVMACGSAGREQIFKTYFSSCCGGVTNPADGLEPQPEGRLAPLAGGVECRDCASAPRYRWSTTRVKKTDAFTALARSYTQAALMGGLRDIRVVETTPWGRPQWIDAIGTDGQSIRIRADDLRLALLRSRPDGAAGLYSVNCTIRTSGQYVIFENGRGYGHSVGLCQFGSQGKALRGLPYYEILYSYYPKAIVKRLY